MLWASIVGMLVIAIMIVVMPIYRAEKRISMTILATTVIFVGVSAGVYTKVGTPGIGAVQTESPDVDAMVASLAARLQENPEDLAGWKMLGRSHFTIRNYDGAVAAFEKAVALDSGRDGQTLADLGEAVLYSDQSALLGRAGELFENALAVQPNNPKALFYGGMAAVERGNKALGADRWETLLATSPPPNVQEILRQQIAELRGTTVVPASEPNSLAAVSVNVSLGESALAAELPNATVFVIARDPAQPSPPIAAVRRQLSELPATVSISDSDAMIPGRVLSGFQNLEIVARVSMSGQPIAASGDWFGQQVINLTSETSIDITIDQQVP